jgi:hypothetical protein
MIDILFIALFQSAAGPLESPQETSPAAQTETSDATAERRRCRTRAATGSRVVRVERCRAPTRDEREEARAAMEAFQGPSGWQEPLLLDGATTTAVNTGKWPY